MSPGVRNVWIGFIGGLVLLGVLGVGVVAILLDREVARVKAEEEAEKKSTPAARKSRFNAKCILCKTRFSIPEMHRGTVAEWTRDYSCPNCGVRNFAGSLYQWAEEKTEKTNAMCPFCAIRFNIPEKHKGDPSAHTTDYHCPGCGGKSTAAQLYSDGERVVPPSK